MSGTGESDARTLQQLRDKIDAIDAEIHRLLIARGGVIDSLIRTKGTSRPGAAFRPGREADMMRRLAARHEGRLPLATVEHIWREIITTFTRMQAPFDIAVDLSFEPERMRDLARFTFGFSVKLLPMDGPAAVVAHVAETGELGLIACDRPGEGSAWWRGLSGPSAPRIMALLPFIRAAERPADLPAFVISPRLSDPTPPDIRIYAVAGRTAIVGGALLASSGDERLVALAAGKHAPAGAVEVGGIARGIAIDWPSSILYKALDVREAVR